MCLGVRITSRFLYSIWTTSADPCTVSGPPLWQGNRPWVDFEVSAVREMFVGVRITSRSLYSNWITSVTGKQTSSWYWSKYFTGDMCMGVKITSRSLYNIWTTSVTGKQTLSWYWSDYCTGDMCMGVRITSRSLYSIWITSMTGKQTLSCWSKYCTVEVCVWNWGLPADPCTVSGQPLWQGNWPWVDIKVSTVL